MRYSCSYMRSSLKGSSRFIEGKHQDLLWLCVVTWLHMSGLRSLQNVTTRCVEGLNRLWSSAEVIGGKSSVWTSSGTVRKGECATLYRYMKVQNINSITTMLTVNRQEASGTSSSIEGRLLSEGEHDGPRCHIRRLFTTNYFNFGRIRGQLPDFPKHTHRNSDSAGKSASEREPERESFPGNGHTAHSIFPSMRIYSLGDRGIQIIHVQLCDR